MTVAQSIGNSLQYAWGQCTQLVAALDPWVMAGWGNASDWLGNASRAGFATSATPVPGSIAVWGAGQGGAGSFGHVAAVTGVTQAGTPVVREANWTYGTGGVDTRVVTPSSAAGIIGYILPPSTYRPVPPSAHLTDFKPFPSNPLWNPSLPLPGPDFGPGSPSAGVLNPGGIPGVGDITGGITSGIANAFLSVLQTLAKPFEDVVLRLLIGVVGAVLIIVALKTAAGAAENEDKGDGNSKPRIIGGGGAGASHLGAGDAEALAA